MNLARIHGNQLTLKFCVWRLKIDRGLVLNEQGETEKIDMGMLYEWSKIVYELVLKK